MRKSWPHIRITDVQTDASSAVTVGDEVKVSVTVQLDGIEPEFVRVQVYGGETENGAIVKPQTVDLAKAKKLDGGHYLFAGTLHARESGTYGMNVRVIPTHPHLIQAHELRLITWAK
jgi:starch phosphorylase